MPTDIEAYNEEIRKWSKASTEDIRRALIGIGARKSGLIIKELRSRIALKFGTVNRVTFQFPRHLVFIEKGASKGYGGRKGSRWNSADGETRKTDPRSLGRMGTGARPARPTFNPTMERQMLVLVGIMQRHYADAAAKGILIK